MKLMTRRYLLLVATGAAAGLGQAVSAGRARGVPMAAITIELFSDFQCPACKTLHEQTLKPLTTDYVDKGKVYLIHREFPLPMHAYAREAAGYACAAARVGKYDQVADALFATQEVWSKDGKLEEALKRALTPAEIAKVRTMAKAPDIAAEVERDTQKGKDARLTQTPTMIVTHKSKTYPVSGVVSYPIMRRFLDQLLSQ